MPHLSGDCNLIKMLILYRTVCLVRVVEDDGHCSLCHPSLTLFVHQLLQAIGSNLHRVVSRTAADILAVCQRLKGELVWALRDTTRKLVCIFIGFRRKRTRIIGVS